MDHAEPSDADLLRELRSHPSEAAFRRLVERHLPTVWSTARRVLAAEPSLVDDVVQRVFTDLAGRVGTLRADGSLGPWLHRHTWFRATAALRAERRRRHRETTAAAMHEPSADEAWSDLAPHLDAALASLPEADRQAIVLRYFEDRSLRSVGDSLGLSEDSARKRVSRALEKLRGKLTRRGVTLGVAALASSLAAHAAEPAPVALAQTVSTAAWARRSAAGGVLGSLLMGLRVLRRVKWLALAIVVSLAVAAVVWMLHGAGNVGGLFAPTSPPTPRSPLPPGNPFRLRLALFALREADPGGLMPDVPEDATEAGDLLTKFFDAAVRDRARLDQPADDQSPSAISASTMPH